MREAKKTCLDWGEAIVPALALVFGASFFFQTMDAPRKAIIWPIIVASTVGVFWICILAAFVIKRAPLRERTTQGGDSKPMKTKGPVMVLAGTVLYLAVIPWLGFSLSNFVFMISIFRALGGTNWTRNLIVASIISLFLHLVLVYFMQLSVPRLELGGITI